jgi:phosphoenolpyruvate carboxykinase (GTP)
MQPTIPARDVRAWVASVAELTQPDDVVWYTGTPQEAAALTRHLVTAGTLVALDPDLRPGSYLARTSPEDVARVENRTYICSESSADAGPTNNWCPPDDMRAQLDVVFEGSMRGRTMYVVPFSMGEPGGPLSQLGVEITDSPYVVLSMGIMTRLGTAVQEAVEGGAPWVATVHSVGRPLRDSFGEVRPDVAWPCNGSKYVAHFPETREIWSFGSGYGGNALLAKKCFALRIASVMARDEGWLAEHMLLIRVTTPGGRRFHVAAAFPSACGKTNLAMLTAQKPGWSVETIGDDIAWMRPGADGRLWAVNPEAGLFGVAPGTGEATNPVAVETLWGNTIFTNVALTDDGDVWWEGLTASPPDHLIDWRGEHWTPSSGRPAAHPNARFTTPLDQCPTLAADVAGGVPVDAIVFGGRRATAVPLVAQAADWAQGVFMGATTASEQTAAAEGTVGVLRRDPFAMLPFCGYDMADYWAHWLRVGDGLGSGAPAVFQVNWFRKGDDGGYLWPGFGENARVLEWIVARLEGRVGGVETPIGVVPLAEDLDTAGLDVDDDALRQLLEVDPVTWAAECASVATFFDRFDGRTPPRLREQLARLTAAFAEPAPSELVPVLV